MSEDIYHYGIKGMKWGVRRSPVELSRTSAKREALRSNVKGMTSKQRTEKIRSARERQAKRQVEVFSNYNKVKKAKKELKLVQKGGKDSAIKAKQKGLEAAKKELKRSKDRYINTKDFHMSNRTTRGEKAAIVIVSSFVPGLGYMGGASVIGINAALNNLAMKNNASRLTR